MKRTFLVVCACAALCFLGLTVALSVEKMQSGKAGPFSSAGDASRMEAKTQADTAHFALPIDPARVEALPTGPVTEQVEPSGSLKAQIKELMAELAAQVSRGLDANRIKMRISELLGQSAPQQKASSVSASKGRPLVADSSVLRELGTTSAKAPVLPVQRKIASRAASGESKAISLPEGVTLSASAEAGRSAEKAVRSFSKAEQHEVDEFTRQEVESLQRQAEEVQASGGDVSTIKERINELLSQSGGGKLLGCDLSLVFTQRP